MKRFFAGVAFHLRRLLRRPSLLACLLALPLLAVLLGLFAPAGGGQNPIRVGVLLPQNSKNAPLIWQGMQRYSDDSITYEAAESRAQLEAMVGSTAWECGYLFPEDLDARIEAGRYNRLITRVESPATSTAFLVDYNVMACLLDACAPDIAAGLLGKSGVVPAGGIPEDLSGFKVQYQMDFDTVTVGTGQPVTPSAANLGASLLRGAVALLLMLFCCLVAARHLQEATTGFYTRLLPYTGAGQLYFSLFAAAGLLAALAGLSALGVSALFFPGYFASPLWEGACLLLYLCQLAALSFLLASLFRRAETLAALLPFLLVACLLFSPVVLDISRYVSAARYIAPLMPPTLYLRAAGGQAQALWQMALYTLALVPLALLPALRRRGLRHAA